MVTRRLGKPSPLLMLCRSDQQVKQLIFEQFFLFVFV